MIDNIKDESLTTLLNTLNEYVWIRKPSGHVDFVNRAAEAALGVTWREWRTDPRAYLRHIVPEDRENVIAAGKAADEAAVEIEFHVQLPDEERRRLRARVSPLHGPSGEATAILGIAEDVTAEERPGQLREQLTRVQHERDQAKSSEGQIRAMLDRLTDAFLALDRGWRISYVNRRFEELLGTDASEVIGKTMFEAFPEFHGSPFYAQYERAFRDNVTVEFEAFWAPSGTWYQVHAYPSAEGLSVFFHDVTEKRRLEMELVEATVRERQRVGADLHDSVGQKLTGAALLTSALQARASAGAAVDPAELATVRDVLSDLVVEIRRISRGLFPVELEEQSLPAALENLARDVEDLFGTSCQTDLSPGITFGPETEVHILRIAQELITNAVKHGGASEVRMGLRCTPRGVELSVQHDGTPAEADRSERYGLGLRSMEYRSKAIGAVIETVGLREGGARTTCRMPL